MSNATYASDCVIFETNSSKYEDNFCCNSFRAACLRWAAVLIWMPSSSAIRASDLPASHYRRARRCAGVSSRSMRCKISVFS